MSWESFNIYVWDRMEVLNKNLSLYALRQYGQKRTCTHCWDLEQKRIWLCRSLLLYATLITPGRSITWQTRYETSTLLYLQESFIWFFVPLEYVVQWVNVALRVIYRLVCLCEPISSDFPCSRCVDRYAGKSMKSRERTSSPQFWLGSCY